MLCHGITILYLKLLNAPMVEDCSHKKKVAGTNEKCGESNKDDLIRNVRQGQSDEHNGIHDILSDNSFTKDGI